MTISGKYELLRPVVSGGFRSFHARHVVTGHQVMVHFLDPGQRFDAHPPLAGQAVADGGGPAQILDAGSYEGTPYLVTNPIENFTSLPAWLESIAPARSTAATPPVAPVSPPPRSRTELAAGFQDVTPGNQPAGPGEFTAMFGSPAGTPAAAQPPPAPPAPSNSSDATGGFTEMFGVPPAPPRQASPVAEQASSGEFSQMFLPGERGPLPTPPPELARPVVAPPQPAPSAAAGEFTMWARNHGSVSESGGQAALAPPPPPAPTRPAMAQPPSAAAPNAVFEGATQVFQGPLSTPPSAPPPVPKASSGPGEFTMIVRGTPSAGPVAMPPPAPPATPAAPVFQAPSMSAPSMSGPSISPGGITAPSVHMPSISAPRLDVPPISAPVVRAPVVGAGGATFSPLVAAILSCVVTVALLAIVYVLIKR